MTFRKFEKISKFSDVTHYLNHNDLKDPMLFVGTVKLHGTNAGLYFKGDDTFEVQSRNRTLTPTSDNMGFADFAYKNKSYLQAKVKSLFPFQYEEGMWVYGEWVGPGIQHGVGINKLPQRQFVIFATQDNEGAVPGGFLAFEDALEDHDQIFHITEVPIYTFTLDLQDLEAYTEARNFIAASTEAVDKACPWAAKFGIEGIGEGIVWCGDFGLRFKSKGESHTNPENCKKIKVLDSPEIIADRVSFSLKYVDNRRVEQGIEYLTEMGHPVSKSSTGIYLGWISKDIEAETRTEREASSLEWNPLSKVCARRARELFFEKLEQL